MQKVIRHSSEDDIRVDLTVGRNQGILLVDEVSVGMPLDDSKATFLVLKIVS